MPRDRSITAILLAFCIASFTVSASGQVEPEHLIIGGTVERVVGSGVFLIEDRRAADGALLVIAPFAQATPVAGTAVIARGSLRRIEDAELGRLRGWRELDETTRARFAGRRVLVAASLSTAGGAELISPSAQVRTASPFARRAASESPRDPLPLRFHPGGLAELVDYVGGRLVDLPAARVLVVLNPRAFLIDSSSPLEPVRGNFDRLLVLVENGVLRAAPDWIVGSNVRVLGTARTLLGLQVSGEVPLPKELTPDVIKRFEIRAAVLATSVQTSDGVELTDRGSPAGVNR
jgi:hypothetical protein